MQINLDYVARVCYASISRVDVMDSRLKGYAYKNDVMMTDLPKKVILFCVAQVKGVT